jgi:pimeloyl-ACP methyl ester carboxylesterase
MDEIQRSIPIEGGTIAALEFGDPQRPLDILFLHANGFNASTYRSILAPLAPTLRILAIDMRGHGHTTLPTNQEGQSWQIYADDVIRVLAALQETPRILAGHSMGGATALLTAPLLPYRPNLVMIDPVVTAPEIYQNATGAPEWHQPMAQAALRRKATFATTEEAFAAYRGRGAFTTWPDTTLRDYLQDGLTPNPDGSVTLSCAPAWEAANFACYGISTPYPGFQAAASVHILKAQTGSVCYATPTQPGLQTHTFETIPATTHFLPMERPDIVQKSLRAAAGCV